MAAAVLGLAFLLSGIGNMLGTVDGSGLRVSSAWPAWLSPIGWGQQTRPFGGDQWWPLGLSVIAFAVLVGVAVALAGRRDVGRGMWPERIGHAHAGVALLSPVGLFWRLQRGAFLGWDRFNIEHFNPDAERIETVCSVLAEGYVDQLHFSHDGATFHDFMVGDPMFAGEEADYLHLSNVILPQLRERGVSDADIDRIMVDNPRRWLTGDGA